MTDIEVPTLDEVELPTEKGAQVRFSVAGRPVSLQNDNPGAWTLLDGGRHLVCFGEVAGGGYQIADNGMPEEPFDAWRELVRWRLRE